MSEYTSPGLPILTRAGGPDILVTQAFADVAKERQRQIFDEGWTAEHDDAENKHGELARAGAAYALHAGSWQSLSAEAQEYGFERAGKENIKNFHWPWDRNWWRPTSVRRSLVKAAALIIAAIEQIDRRENG